MAGLSSPQKQIMSQLLSLTHFGVSVLYSNNSASETVSRKSVMLNLDFQAKSCLFDKEFAIMVETFLPQSGR